MPQELVCLLESVEISPVTVEQIKTWTDRDPVLAKVRKFVQQGWPKSVDPVFRPYHSKTQYSRKLFVVGESYHCTQTRKDTITGSTSRGTSWYFKDEGTSS